MEQDFSVGIIGAGPAGCTCAYFLKKIKPEIKVYLIDFNTPMKTILVTGGGRCNLANAEFDFKELAKNYPRGEKFLYSIFSRFSTAETLEFFEELGIETYTQEDNRIFPISNSAKEVQNKFLNALKSCKHIKEKALRIEKTEHGFKVITDMGAYYFNKLVYSVGGRAGYDMIERLGISTIEPKPSLVGLVTNEKFTELMGVTLKNISNKETGLTGDILFTHFGVTGPLIYKISSINARKKIPYSLSFDICSNLEDFQEVLNNNSHKYIKNILSNYIPQKLGEYILNKVNINPDTLAHKIDGKTRDRLLNEIHNFKLTVKSTQKDGETVTSGGVDLDKINPQTMESKEISDLYFCGEVIDVDGYCGGFNLQNCWSTGYLCANRITQEINQSSSIK